MPTAFITSNPNIIMDNSIWITYTSADQLNVISKASSSMSMSVTSIGNNGSLLAGTYQLAYRLKNTTPIRYTKWSTFTNPVPAIPLPYSVTNINYYGGLFNTQTSRSINYSITIDASETSSTYDSVEIAVVKNNDGTYVEQKVAYINAIPNRNSAGPVTGTYKIIAAGAMGGNSYGNDYRGGKGLILSIKTTLTKGEIIKILVGQGGLTGQNDTGTGGGGGAARVMALLKAMAINEGALAMISTSTRNHDGTIFAQGGGAYKGTDPANFLDMAVGVEDYNTLLRLAKSGTPVNFDLDVKSSFQDKDLQGYNVIAEIEGTDPLLKDEVVMIGAHLDSWQAGTGATDNAAGSAVMMEAMRILKAIGINPKRTIRIGLWSGEEQGLLGSRGYVKKTFTGDQAAAAEKFSGYFNIDNGTGKIRGIYLQGNEACGPIFSSWLAPFKDLGASTVTISTTGGTDHQSFDGIGLPGFQFIQDPIEYNTRTHHSNMDVYDHLIEDDLKQIATIVAAFAYNTAQRDAKLPRKGKN